tara:strand:- start:40 stop:201 length:162 start_codon:yes stop_codon:yes gene_type:complete
MEKDIRNEVKMPFKSKKQLMYLKINNPKLYNKWIEKYGSKTKGTKTKKARRKK